MLIDDTVSVEGIYAFIYCTKWRSGQVSPMPDSLTHSLTTLKDSATQLLIKYKNGALVTQYAFSKMFFYCSYEIALNCCNILSSWQTFLCLAGICAFASIYSECRYIYMGLQFCKSELNLTALYELMKCQFHVFASYGIPNT